MEKFMEMFKEAAENDTRVYYTVTTPRFLIFGGNIDTMTFNEDSEAIELHTEDGDDDIVIYKTDTPVMVEPEDGSVGFEFGELTIIFDGNLKKQL